MGLLSREKESDCILLIDIGSGSVGAALALLANRGVPRLLYVTRRDILLQGHPSGQRLFSLMLRALSQALLDVTAEGFSVAGFAGGRPHLREAFVSLSAPWVSSHTAFLQLRTAEAVPVTEALLSQLIEAEERERHPHPYSVCVEQKLIKAELNGYETPAPFGRRALLAEFSVFKSFAPVRVAEQVRDGIAHHLSVGTVSFHSFSLLAVSVIRDLVPVARDFLFVDVSGELTEVSVIKRDVIAETASFPFGRAALLRGLRRETAVPEAGAASLLRLRTPGSRGRLPRATDSTLSRLAAEWRRHFERALSAFSAELFVPTTVYMTADDDVLSLFSECVSAVEASKLTLATASLSPVLLSRELRGKGAREALASDDPFLELEIRAANILRTHSTIAYT